MCSEIRYGKGLSSLLKFSGPNYLAKGIRVGVHAPRVSHFVGPRNATRGGVNGSLRKLSQLKTSAQDPKAHPNPRVLGVVQSSYRRATRTLKTLGTSEIERGSKHTKSAR